ncbi:hypothetical protein LCGC14_2561040 [marine sediment metagenome]|uniref:Uncharacterized protein n=1 Tax=marine sediment metagenome TaxID=412755 RepID=A0A0F9AKM0_9ZZZZ
MRTFSTSCSLLICYIFWYSKMKKKEKEWNNFIVPKFEKLIVLIEEVDGDEGTLGFVKGVMANGTRYHNLTDGMKEGLNKVRERYKRMKAAHGTAPTSGTLRAELDKLPY